MTERRRTCKFEDFVFQAQKGTLDTIRDGVQQLFFQQFPAGLLIPGVRWAKVGAGPKKKSLVASKKN